jgi:hypothetical protein
MDASPCPCPLGAKPDLAGYPARLPRSKDDKEVHQASASDVYSSFCHTTVNRTTFPKSRLIAGAVSMINLSPLSLK